MIYHVSFGKIRQVYKASGWRGKAWEKKTCSTLKKKALICWDRGGGWSEPPSLLLAAIIGPFRLRTPPAIQPHLPVRTRKKYILNWSRELRTMITKKKSRKILIYNYAMHVSWLFCEYLFASPPKKEDMCRGKEADVNICTLASVRSFVFLCFWLFFSACRCKYLNLVMRFALPRCRVGKIL